MRTLLAALAALAGLPLLLGAVVLVAPFRIAGWLTERLARLLQPSARGWRELIAFHPQVGWKPRPSLVCHALDFNGDAFHVETDEHGWRGHTDLSACDVIVFGDSFAFGSGIDEHAFFANLPGARVKAIGAPGYNMVQSLWWMERMSEALRGKLVVWLLYPANDLEDNIRPQMQGYRMPFVRRTPAGSWKVVTSHVRREPWPFPPRRSNYETYVDICSSGPLAERVFSACEYLMRRAADTCRRANARLVIMTVPDLSPMNLRLTAAAIAARPTPHAFDPELPDRRIAELARGLRIEYFALKNVLDSADYLRHDVHWNAGGHRRVANVLARLAASPLPHRPVSVKRMITAGASTAARQPTVAG